MSSPWDILEIEPTNDLYIIKNAYAKLIKSYRPETNPQKFKEIRAAYEEIVNAINQGTDLTTANLQAKPNKAELNERERLFAALDYLMSIYDDNDSKNDLKKWKTALLENSLILNLENLASTGHSLLREILKYEFLYKSEVKLIPDIYLTLFNFFNLDYKSYLTDNYNQAIADELITNISKLERSLREIATPATKFNEYTPEYQVDSEIFLEEEILAHSKIELIKRGVLLCAMFNRQASAKKKVMARVAFKYILEDYLTPHPALDNTQIKVIFYIFKFKYKRYDFMRNLSKLGYHKQDIINCFKFCHKTYQQSRGIGQVFYSLITRILLLMLLGKCLGWFAY